jgi:DNA polymerase I-like protein with 3'-5' exonuclease and polymerase domains
MSSIYLVGNAPESSKYILSTWEKFTQWETEQSEFQLDIETSVSDYWSDRKLITIQFGSVGLSKAQWVLQWSTLTPAQQQYVKDIVEGNRLKLIHNAAFEIIVLRFHDMILCNPYDTMLAEKILTGGIENENYALSDLCFKYLQLVLDKSEQKTFGDDILTENKVVYAALDVTYLDTIRSLQQPDITLWNLDRVLALENEAVLGFSDITFHGIKLDIQKWNSNIEFAQPIVDASRAKLNSWLLSEEFKPRALEIGCLSETDKLLFNPNSHQDKSELLQLLFPCIPGSTKPVITKYIRDNGSNLSTEDLNILVSLQEKNTVPMCNKLIRDHYQYLVNNGFLLPANVPSINWNSVQQVLPILKVIAPRLRDLSEESLANVTHGIIEDLAEYKNSLKLISTYGQTFIDKHVNPDGKVRTEFNQIVSTGRVSSKRPNMQNIPAKESVGNRYRNAFVCEEDEVFVDSDFTGQELAIIAHISKDPVWLGTIERGEDLHSVCAELVYGAKWADLKNNDCAYYAKTPTGIAKQKCSCSRHKSLRNAVKTVNFGLAYGMSDMKLSGTLKITLPEAKLLTEQYFKAFPKIGATLKYLGEFGVKNGYIQTISPMFRKRWFPFWKFAKGRINMHLAGQYDQTLGTIERAAKNQPVQGTGADMMKLAMVLVRRWIYTNGYKDSIKLVAQVHDQLTTICKQNLSEMWKVKFDELMQEAAKVFIPSGILKADTQISNCWTK